MSQKPNKILCSYVKNLCSYVQKNKQNLMFLCLKNHAQPNKILCSYVQKTMLSLILHFKQHIMFLVGLDDALHELVAHDVLLAELYLAYAFHAIEHLESLYQTRSYAAWQVNLGGVAGDDHLRPHA